MKPLEFLEKLRYELQEINLKISRHRFIEDLSQGKISIDKIRNLLQQQYYIARSDSKALALMYSRSEYPDNDFFLKLIISHQEAIKKVDESLDKLGIKKETIVPNPRAVAFTHFFFYIAYFRSLPEQIILILINFPIFIENINKIGLLINKNYNLYLPFFVEAKWDRELEYFALKILEKYSLEEYKEIPLLALTIQKYELEFWNAIYEETF
ncbi:MAG TPA: hypothetical protein VKU94_00560 [Geobacterales bacterium]|nr:hypothetical protein [Geobacterales bacterium]